MTDTKQSSVRSQRARLSLTGLSIGDGFGQRFFFPGIARSASPEKLPEGTWHHTDDTEMAMAIVEVLEEHGEIDRDALAGTFARRYSADPGRGYGAGAHELMLQIGDGADWREASRQLFGGQGSFGNGGAMRVAPLGGWFADDVDATIDNAGRSAEVTHAHPEGQAGAIAVALAAGWAWRWNDTGRSEPSEQMLPWITDRLPDSEVSQSVKRASEIPLDTSPFDVARELGCGESVTARDTVAFCLWTAALHMSDYCQAMWTTARAGGDIDTTSAIVGGILALSVGQEGIPDSWRKHQEPLTW